MKLNPLYWPAIFYGPDGQDQLFETPDQVPEGWHDDPAKVGDPDAVTVIQGLDEYEAANSGGSDDDGDDDGDEEPEFVLPEYDSVTAAEIKALLDEREIEYADNDKKAELYEKLTNAVNAAE